MSTKKLSKSFTEGNIAKQLLLFSLPFMASNALLVLYSTIDMIIVGEYVGTAGLELCHYGLPRLFKCRSGAPRSGSGR